LVDYTDSPPVPQAVSLRRLRRLRWAGDVLAGTITGLLAQGVEAFDAACLGAWLHGRAGEECEAEIGPAGVLAGDLLGYLPVVMNELRG
jgi:ADP-dependent NAD(P)H-hydrate dehydratase / NAD(P)H-hydrate epimerase